MNRTKENLLSVSQLLETAVQINPKREAIYDLCRRLTYHELNEEVQKIASALVSMGVEKGDRVGVSLPNWHETVALFFAIAKIGAILVPFNPKYRSHEVAHIIRNSGAKIVFVSEEFEKIGFDHEEIGAVVSEYITVRFKKEGFRSFQDVITDSRITALPTVETNPINDTFCILYTSGTTGTPKGVMIPHRSVVQSGIAIASALRCTSSDVLIIPAPLFHIFGMSVNLMSAVSCQAKMVLQGKFSPEETLKMIEQEKVSIHHAVPAILNIELNHPNFGLYDLSSLRAGITGAATCPPETIKAVREKMGMELYISYGITEAGAVTITEYEDKEENMYETVGKAVEGAEVKIVNDQREALPPEQIGEIACRGFGVMKGYYNLPEATDQVLDQEGWFYTGDLGMLTHDNYVRYVGRKKELIIRGGYNIYPPELEKVLQKHQKILESAVIGLPDPVLGEAVCAVIKLKSGYQSSAEEIIEYLKPFFAKYKLPTVIKFVENFPVTASGKIQKVKLRDELLKSQKNK